MRRSVWILVFIALAACRKEAEPVKLSIQLSVNQPTTLDDILCTARLIGPSDMDTADYLFRWDWESDQIWDTRYSAVTAVRKKFTEPGNYQLMVQALSTRGDVLTSTCLITVKQGFSAPRPAFSCYPDSGNFKTVFTFDASKTLDNEEETSLLTFSWDFDNDQSFEVVQKGNPMVQHSFPTAGIQKVTLLVRDTSKLWGRLQKEIIVNQIDTLIVPRLSISPEFPSDRDTLILDAGKSYYTGKPSMVLRYSWKKYNGSWTPVSENPLFTWIFPTSSTNLIKCRIYSEENLYNEKEIEVVVSRANRAPTARITKSMRFGNIQSVFEFSAWNSSDPENLPSELKAQWDFEGDGIWDTPEDYNKKVSWSYSVPGIYRATLRITDLGGLKNTVNTDIRVSPYSNPMSYIQDIRDQQTYGIVKIGDQWWMGENLRYKGGICYQDRADFCEATGPLYLASDILAGRTGDIESTNICPRGWHVPNMNDWNILLDEVGRESAGTALNYGGKSDFNILLGGYCYYNEYNEFIQDSVHRVAYFMTASSDSVNALQYRRDETTVQFRKMTTMGYYSIRCVKNE